MTRDGYFELIRQICPRCAEGEPVRFRAETAEWVHDGFRRTSPTTLVVNHGLCFAHYFRKVHPEFSANG